MKNYVKKYKGYDVPEGATHYGPDIEEYCEGWYMVNEDSGEIKFQNIDGKLWHLNHYCIPDSAIELPEEPIAEWMPEVGQECEVTDHWNDFERPDNLKDGQKVKILMSYRCPKTGTDGVIFTWIEGADNIRTEWTGNEKHFRPLKTKEEKEREAFIKSFMSALSEETNKEFWGKNYDGIISDLIKSGFTAPKESE